MGRRPGDLRELCLALVPRPSAAGEAVGGLGCLGVLPGQRYLSSHLLAAKPPPWVG